MMACTESVDVSSREHSFEGGGVYRTTIHLPGSPAVELQCVQGVGGSYSHTSRSTYYDIDLDTSNIRDESVYAPADGIAFVHMHNSHMNFGKHVNIDLGDGTYVVIAHMSKIVVSDNAEVATGQLLGLEGCTGSCTGDHIHVGLHRGNAAQPAQYGESVPVRYHVADNTEPRGHKPLDVEETVCGLRAFGDNQNGQFYTSALDVTLFHPNGTLVKTSNNARVYLIDNGQLRHIANERTFHSYGYSFMDVAIISDEERSCYPEGPVLDLVGMVDAVTDDNDQIWLLVGPRQRSDRYRIRVRNEAFEQVLESWGVNVGLQGPRQVRSNARELAQWPVRSGTARFRDGSLVREQDRSDVYLISDSVALPIANWQTYLRLGFYDRQVLMVGNGELAQVQRAAGNCLVGSNCLDGYNISVCGNDLRLDLRHESDTSGDLQVAGFRENENEEHNGEKEEQEGDGESEEEVVAGTTLDESEDEEREIEAGVTPLCNGQDACLHDNDGDDKAEFLLMRNHQWLNPDLHDEFAVVYGNGGCFNNRFEPGDVFYPRDGYYWIDFTVFDRPCSSELTLISVVGTDGEDPRPSMDNWYWWQNAPFCSQGSMLCNLMNNGVPWEEWLVSVAWHPDQGLLPNGNGFTRNTQLH